MPSLFRKLPMLAVLALSASLHSTLASAQSSLVGVAALNGQYAFLLKGTLTTPGLASRATAAAGSFTADGQGNITSGEMDFTSAAQTFQALPITGTYTLDSNTGAGTLNVKSAKGTESFAFYATGTDLSATNVFTSASLIETDAGPVVSSGSFYLQAPAAFFTLGVYGYWQTALTGETFVSEGSPSPILVGGSLYLNLQADHQFLSITRRVGSGAPESISGSLVLAGNADSNGRINFAAYGYPLNVAAYIIDVFHILVVSTDSPQVNPLLSGTMARDLEPSL